MIQDIITALRHDFPSESEYVAIARGKNKLSTTFKEGVDEIRTIWQSKRK